MTPEEFVDRRGIAAIMGLSERTITRLRARGMPSHTYATMPRTRRYLPSECIAWARAGDVGVSTMIAEADGRNTVGQRQSKE